MGRPRRAIVLVCALAPCATACFDVQELPLEPPEEVARQGALLLIDDFEDGDPWPSTAAFAPWRCRTYNPGPGLQPVQCGSAVQGSESNHGYSLWFKLEDPPNGIPDYPGASLFAPTTAASFDLSPYAVIGLSAKLETDETRPPELSLLSVAIYCDGMSDTSSSVENLAPVATSWGHIALRLANFAQPDWQLDHVDPATCLTQVTSISVEVQIPLEDGQTGTGTLEVDDVYLQ